MKKRTTSLLIVIMVIAMIMTLSACGGKTTLPGNWKISSLETGGVKFSAKDAAAMGFSFEVSLNEDKTASIETLGIELKGTWKTNDDITAVADVTIEGSPTSSTFTFKLDGNKLIMDQDGQKITFEKK